MSSNTLPSITQIVNATPVSLQSQALTAVSNSSTAIDKAFANSPAVSHIESVNSRDSFQGTAPEGDTRPDELQTLREHVTFPSEWQNILNLLGHSTWEEHNTGMSVEVIQQEPDRNYLLFSPPRTPGTTTVAVQESLEIAYLGAQLLIDMATSREQSAYIGLSPAETADLVTAEDERGTQYPTERLTLPDPIREEDSADIFGNLSELLES